MILKITMSPGDVFRVWFGDVQRQFTMPESMYDPIQFDFDTHNPWPSVGHLEEISETPVTPGT